MGYYVFHSSHIPTICPKCLEMWDKWCIFAVEFEIMTMMKRRLKEPINIRIIHESVYAGIFVFLLLWLTMPFNVETIHDGRPLFFLAQSVITTVVSMIIGLFTAHILRMPMDPKLPLNTVHRNSIVNYLINIPILALALTLFGGFFFCNNPIEPWFIHTFYGAKHCPNDDPTCFMKDAKGHGNFEIQDKLCDACKQ